MRNKYDNDDRPLQLSIRGLFKNKVFLAVFALAAIYLALIVESKVSNVLRINAEKDSYSFRKTIPDIDKYVNVTAVNVKPSLLFPKSKLTIIDRESVYRKATKVVRKPAKTINGLSDLPKSNWKAFYFTLSHMRLKNTDVHNVMPFSLLESKLNELGYKDALHTYVVRTNHTVPSIQDKSNAVLEALMSPDSRADKTIDLRHRYIEPYGRPDTVYRFFISLFKGLINLAEAPFNHWHYKGTGVYVIVDSENNVRSAFMHRKAFGDRKISKFIDSNYSVANSVAIAENLAMVIKEDLKIKSFDVEKLFPKGAYVFGKPPTIKDPSHDVDKSVINAMEFYTTFDVKKEVGKSVKAFEQFKSDHKDMIPKTPLR